MIYLVIKSLVDVPFCCISLFDTYLLSKVYKVLCLYSYSSYTMQFAVYASHAYHWNESEPFSWLTMCQFLLYIPCIEVDLTKPSFSSRETYWLFTNIQDKYSVARLAFKSTFLHAWRKFILPSLKLFRFFCVSFWLHSCCGWQGWIPLNRFTYTSWVAVVSSTDCLKSVRNRCVIEGFGGVFCVVTLLFGFFLWL